MTYPGTEYQTKQLLVDALEQCFSTGVPPNLKKEQFSIVHCIIT